MIGGKDMKGPTERSEEKNKLVRDWRVKPCLTTRASSSPSNVALNVALVALIRMKRRKEGQVKETGEHLVQKGMLRLSLKMMQKKRKRRVKMKRAVRRVKRSLKPKTKMEKRLQRKMRKKIPMKSLMRN